MNILLIGAGKHQCVAIEEAHKLKLKVIALDQNPEAEGFKTADYKEVGDIRDFGWLEDVALKYNSEIGIDGCLACGVEVAESVGLVNDLLGLQGVGRCVASEMTNKVSRLEDLCDYGIRTPKFAVSDKNIKNNWNIFPCVVKPSRGSAAENVRYIENRFQLQAEEFDLIEEYIEGHELNTETIVLTDNLYMTYISDRNYNKKFTYKPYMIEDGTDMPSKIDDNIKNKVHHTIGKIIRCFQLEKCILKCDLIVKDNIVYVLECTPRLSGGRYCSHTVPMSTGVELLNIAIRMAVGIPVYPQELVPKKNIHVSQRYFFEEGKDIKSHRDRGPDFIVSGRTMKEAIENAEKKVKDAMQQRLQDLPKTTSNKPQ